MPLEYRFASMDDRAFVSQANWAWLQQQAKQGGPILPTLRSHQAHMRVFEAYCQGEAEGFTAIGVLDGTPVGMCLVGDGLQPSSNDSAYGKVANVWLVWVDPTVREQRVALSIQAWARARLKERGFQVALCCVLADNPSGTQLALSFGCVAVETTYRFDI